MTGNANDCSVALSISDAKTNRSLFDCLCQSKFSIGNCHHHQDNWEIAAKCVYLVEVCLKWVAA